MEKQLGGLSRMMDQKTFVSEPKPKMKELMAMLINFVEPEKAVMKDSAPEDPQLLLRNTSSPVQEEQRKVQLNSIGNFSHTAIERGRIDENVRKGKIQDASVDEKKSFRKEKEGETHAIGLGPQGNYHSKHPIHFYPSQRPNYPPDKSQISSSANGQLGRPFIGKGDKRNNSKIIQPIPMSYSELLPKLIKNNQLSPKPSKPLQPPYPEWYDLNARCDYHVGSIGHSTENCTDLKRKVQALRDAKLLSFGEGSTVLNND